MSVSGRMTGPAVAEEAEAGGPGEADLGPGQRGARGHLRPTPRCGGSGAGAAAAGTIAAGRGT